MNSAALSFVPRPADATSDDAKKPDEAQKR
jgi:hypothetical protein